MSRRHSVFKTVVGLAAAAGAAKVGYDQYKKTKEKFAKQEQESENELIRKYNTLFERRVVEADEETFQGCEINAVGSHFILDLGKSVFTKDVYISLSAKGSSVKIILPQNVGAQCDITRTASVVQNFAEDTAEEYDCRVFVIGDAIGSRIEVIPMSFYADDDFDEEDEPKAEESGTEQEAAPEENKPQEQETGKAEETEDKDEAAGSEETTEAPEAKEPEEDEGEEIPISGDSSDDLEVDEVDKD
ncbi:MAG: hypothetical protein LKG56_03185 [Lachnospiraceae bacterium]|jgi:hypothetical protein|nr:hypothetical protein [Lachnospiraceae bacterium]MCH4030684.1 hypothetical protein [Lachnospiraceae bacterium]MCH4069893.1 hypothetical protein [Lachnospiraceae bacterium]MCH4107168.1 hypothetical protein [Lachnospiraceae bacterium]MCI1301977.1 hypothetical protein [Lachnospiraceae bacterium]